MEKRFRIKCNTGYMSYLYWNGVAWTRGLERAAVFDSERAARRCLASLSTPRIAGGGEVPHVFDF